MKKNLLLLFAIVSLVFSACKKSSDDSANYGTEENTWTFTEGSKTFQGALLFDASLNTLLQGNNSYTFSMIGPEQTTGFSFNLVLSLVDLNFATTSYQSGISGNDYINAFYYFESFGSLDNIYKSSNYDPGPVMTFTITSFNATTDVVTITFSGQAVTSTGSTVNITNGKVTAKIERL